MSVWKFAFVVLFGCAMIAQCRAQDENASKQLDKEVLQTIFDGTSSKNGLIRDHSYSLLSKQTGLLQHFNAKKLCSKISSALRDDSLDLGEYGFAILDKSELNDEQKQDLLVQAISSERDWIVDEIFSRLTKSRDTLLPRLIAKIENAPTGSHGQELRLIEHWGHEAKAAVPVLIKHYESLRAAALEKQIDLQDKRRPQPRQRNQPPLSDTPLSDKVVLENAEKYLRFNYLGIVYALAEIGPNAKPAMSIALAAAREKNNRDKDDYNMAGILCIERISGERSLSATDRERQRKMKAFMGSVSKSNGKLAGTLLGSPMLQSSKSKSVREVVANYNAKKADARLAQAATAANSESVEQQVELIFQNHDLLTQIGQLTIEEVRNITPPILLSNVDQDSDKMISKDELRTYLQGKKNRYDEVRRAMSSSGRHDGARGR